MLLAVSTGKVLADLFIYTYVVNGAGAGSKFLTFEIQKVMVTSCNLDLSTGQETTTLNVSYICICFDNSIRKMILNLNLHHIFVVCQNYEYIRSKWGSF